MKRKLFSFLLALLLIMGLSVSVSADAADILDEAGLLTVDEESDLEDVAREIQETYDLDVIILTVNTLDGQSPRRYAEDFYDTYGYGEDGILLLISMEDRDWYILVNGDACDVFDDGALDDLENALLEDLSDGDYYGAFSAYLYTMEGCLSHVSDEDSEYAESGSDRHQEHTSRNEVNIFFSLAAGGISAAITLLIMRSGMNTTKKQSGAAEYMRQGSYHLSEHRDMFLYSRVHKTRKAESSSSSRSGSGSRSRSSGGSRRSGRGGKF